VPRSELELPLLAVMPRWLGDFVMALPALRALAPESGEGLWIDAPPALLELVGHELPAARRIAAATGAAAWRGARSAVLFRSSFGSAWQAWRAGIGRRIGWSRDLRAWLLTERVRPALERGRTPLHVGIARRYPRVLPRAFGADCAELAASVGRPVVRARPQLDPPPAGERAAEARLAALGCRPGEFFVVNAGGRPGSAKAPPVELLAEAIARVASARAAPWLAVCGPGEEPRLAELERAVAGRARLHALARPVAGLGELAALARRSIAFLTGDNGPRHLAAAAGARVVALAGPTDVRHSAAALGRTRLFFAEPPCGPCHRERCPRAGDEHLRCWREHDAARVAAACL
jgi:ADP-heptose:LPS heptosyltransferase